MEPIYKISKDEMDEIIAIAKRHILAVDSRGGLDQHGNDCEDFIECSVWSLQAALETVYLLGKEGKQWNGQ